MALHIKIFIFNPFHENTYIIYNDKQTAVLIDPGCSNEQEECELLSYIKTNRLNLKYLINTHAHIDHILGNKIINEKFNLLPLIHKLDIYNFEYSKLAAKTYHIDYNESPNPEEYLRHGDTLYLDNDIIQIIYTPGHTTGSISLYSPNDNFIICGDTLFENSIGRVDLPGGNIDTLINAIKKQILILPGLTKVYPGHGSYTTVAQEKTFNPFIK